MEEKEQRQSETEKETEKEKSGRMGDVIWAHSLFPFGPFAMDFMRQHLKKGGSIAYIDLECDTTAIRERFMKQVFGDKNLGKAGALKRGKGVKSFQVLDTGTERTDT